MTSTANRQRKVAMPINIRKKLAAAICMLLIAAIMMISSTYAWFTLSTAPEVTGITTNVGANGNLEIALLNEASFNSNLDDLGIKTAVGDSMAVTNKPVTESNVTWGNLVDLSDISYGLDSIILNPAALNIKPIDNTAADKLTGSIIQGGLTSPLLAPSYGADGRVISVQRATTTGIYNNGKFAESLTGAGVRAVGVSSGITARVSAYRKALAAITTNTSAAKKAAQDSLISNGQALASLLVSAVADPNYALTDADVAAINGVTSQLGASNDYIANAIRQAALAKYLSAAGVADLSDDQLAEKEAAFAASELSALATLASPVDLSFLDTIIAKHASVETRLDGVSVSIGDTYTTASAQIAKILDRDYVAINGYAGAELSKDDFGTLAGAIMNAGKVEITMSEGSGVYADIAEMAGNYTASGLRITVTYGDITIPDTPTVMITNVSEPSMLVTAAQSAEGGDPTADGGSTAVENTYGYIIDLGVRTNAAGSTLLLQQNGAQRIYNDSTAELTQGLGTFIEFTTDNRYEFSKEDVTALMGCVRVVFMTPNDANDGYDILAVAAPNIKTTIDNSTGLPIVTTADNRFDESVEFSDSDSDDSTKVSARLYLYDLSDITVQEIVADKEYSTLLGSIKTNENGEADFSIVSLEQNKAKKISALVYLDGDIVNNTMVRNAAQSMTGKVNFQFASSAELVPMENTAVKENGTEEGGSNTTQATPSITKDQLNTAVATIKADAIYTEAVAAKDAGTATAQQTALIDAVASAEAVATDPDVDDEAVTTHAATTLGAAFIAAGGSNPF